MPATYDRDLIGYGANPPNPKWPGGARLAINFVMNYEEGSEPSVQDGEGFTEVGLTEAHRLGQGVKGRDLAGEGMFEIRQQGRFLWRLMRLLQERKLPMTVFGCALALERHKPASRRHPRLLISTSFHGWRWIKHYELTEAEEREHIRKAVASLQTTVGERARLVLPATGRASIRRSASGRAGSCMIRTTMATSCRSGRRSTAGRTSSCPTRSPTTTASTRAGSAPPTSGSLRPRCLRHALQGGRQDAEDDVDRLRMRLIDPARAAGLERLLDYILKPTTR